VGRDRLSVMLGVIGLHVLNGEIKRVTRASTLMALVSSAAFLYTYPILEIELVANHRHCVVSSVHSTW
jgi:predicted nucleic acid-binding Zn ribbon protein